MISDIGIMGQYATTEKSIIYLAPEALEDVHIRSKEGDIYSFGIMLWEMWYGDVAFKQLMPIKLATFQQMIAAGDRPHTDDKLINVPRVNLIMQRCWHNEKDQRISAEDCLEDLQEILKSCYSPTNVNTR